MTTSDVPRTWPGVCLFICRQAERRAADKQHGGGRSQEEPTFARCTWLYSESKQGVQPLRLVATRSAREPAHTPPPPPRLSRSRGLGPVERVAAESKDGVRGGANSSSGTTNSKRGQVTHRAQPSTWQQQQELEGPFRARLALGSIHACCSRAATASRAFPCPGGGS